MAINYTEKGAGLHKAIADAGHFLYWQDGAWVASDEAAVQSIIDGYTLDKAKSARCAEVVALAGDYFKRATASVTPEEMAGWPILRSEALAYNADQTASCPAMTAEAQNRGCTVATLAAKVTANMNYFDPLRAQIAGNSGKHRDAINALADFASVASYDYSTGWPAV